MPSRYFCLAEKVKQLLLLPELEMATREQVAEFYGVGCEAIKSLLARHNGEFIQDGYTSKPGKEIKQILERGHNAPSLSITPKLGHFIIKYKGHESKATYNKVGLFPKRAILRVGMLLRDSEVAKEVRTQLLNIEEHTATSVFFFFRDNLSP